MKYFLIAFVFCSMVAVANANNSLAEICNTSFAFTSADQKTRCLSAIAAIAGKTMNDFAVEACTNPFAFTSPDQQIRCLSAIAGKTMDDSAVEACTNPFTFTTPDKTIKCLADISYENENTASTIVNVNNREEIKNEAINFCRNKTSNLSIEECLDIVVSARFMDIEALNVCKHQSTHLSQMECLSVIVNKTYSPALVEECATKYTDLGQRQCLSRYGSSIEDQENTASTIVNVNNREEIKNEAINFCRNKTSNLSIEECLDIVVSARFMDIEALNVCKHQSTHLSQMECLSVIVNKTYSPALVEECATKYTDLGQRQCLSRYGSSIEDQENTASTIVNVNNREEIKNEAINFCRNKTSNLSIEECLDIVVSARFMDIEALNVCKHQSTHLSQMECLSVIVNKTYSPALVEECATKYTDLGQRQCLSRYGSSIEDQENKSVVIIIQNDQRVQRGFPDCKYKNFYGLYPERGGCNFHGCWVAGGGCNFHGCWYPGGFCNFNGCANEAPKNNICR